MSKYLYKGKNYTHYIQPNHQCRKDISLYTNIVYISRLSIHIHDIKAPTFHPTVHQNLESILVLSV